MRQRGFSLIEVMITITILAVLLGFAMPSAAVWIGNARIRTAAETMLAGLQSARAEAVRRNTRVSFHLVSLTNPKIMGNDCALSSSSASWVVSVASPAGKCATAVSTTTSPFIVKAYPAGDSAATLSVTAVQADGAAATSVTFNGFGQVVGDQPLARVLVNNSTRTDYRRLRVDVSPAGQIRMCDPALTDSTDPRFCPA